jgi:hypothetical protein
MSQVLESEYKLQYFQNKAEGERFGSKFILHFFFNYKNFLKEHINDFYLNDQFKDSHLYSLLK